MRVLIISLIFILKICPFYGQILTIEFGPTFYADKSKVKMHPDIIGKRDANDEYFYKFQYAHMLTENLFFLSSFSKYPISTFFRFYKENEGGSFGWNGTNVNRFDAGVSYIFFPKSQFILNPSISLGIQKSIPDGDGCICSGISGGIKPDDFELLKEIEANAYSNTQIVPVIGFKFGYAFWGRLELFFDIHQVFGHKVIQELRMSYSYKGVEQPQAISYSDGTGRFYALGLGYRFVKPKVK